MGTVSLTNRSRRAITVVLDHHDFRDAKWGFTRKSVTLATHAADGSRGSRIVRRALPGSLHIPAGGTVPGLPRTIAGVTQVKGLLGKHLFLREDPEPTSQVAAPQTDPAPAGSGSGDEPSQPSPTDQSPLTLAPQAQTRRVKVSKQE